MIIPALLIFYLATPLAVLYVCHRYELASKIGSVIIAYALGLILGNIGLLPSMGPVLNEYLLNHPQATAQEVKELFQAGGISNKDWLAYRIYNLRDLVMTVTILLAIPLMLFSTNIKQWKNIAGKSLASLIIGMFSVVVVVIAGYFIFHGAGMKDLWKVSGMLIGVYTGGTPNLASIKMMLDVDAETYILTHTYDLVIGVVYLGFLITIGQRVFHKFLRPFPKNLITPINTTIQEKEPFLSILKKERLLPLLKALGIAAVILVAGVGVSEMVPGNMVMISVILTITTLGIASSLIPSVNRIESTFQAGMYLILVFSLVVASMADVRNFAGLTPGLFGYVTLAVFGSLFLHVLLSRLFKIDADTTIITSTAFICSPPFVPVVAGALKNKDIIISGLTVGIIGYAIGNYLGVTIALLLR